MAAFLTNSKSSPLSLTLHAKIEVLIRLRVPWVWCGIPYWRVEGVSGKIVLIKMHN